MQKRLLAVLTCSLAQPGLVLAAEPLHWPDTGYFPAYPREPDDGDKWDFSVSGGLSHDSNLFRLSDETDTAATLGTSQRSDTIRRLGAGVHGDVPISRQNLNLDIEVNDYTFDRFGFLDYTGHDASLDWDWKAGKLWDGNLGVGHRRYLSSFATLQDRVQDLIDETHGSVSARRAIHPRWRATASLDAYDYEHSAESRSALENQVVAGTLGVQYLTPSNNQLGVELSVSEANYPNREVSESTLVDNEYQEYELSGTADWNLTDASKINGRLGYTTREHNEISERDYSGATYELNYRWTPLAKTTFLLSGYRDLRSYADVSANYILTDGFSAGAAWAPTFRTVLQAEYIDEQWNFGGDPGTAIAGDPTREDQVRGARISAGYMPLDSTRLTISYEHGLRTSNIDSAEYDYDLISGAVEVSF